MVKCGIDNSAGLRKVLQGKRLGLISNPTGVNSNLEHTVDILARNFRLVALYGPEHGIKGEQQAGKETQNSFDSKYKLPIFSLYGKSLRLNDEMLEGVDMLVYDIQDVGARFYTYTSTLAYAMEECDKRNIPFTILERPNPLGCSKCEGFAIRPELDSFVGGYGLTARYALTPGMLAMYIKDKLSLKLELNVVPCLEYDIDSIYPDTRLPWIMPSPNIPTFDSALAYIGTCIFEGTNISEGRGTTHPFEIVGAPFLDAEALVSAMRKHKLPGVLFRETHFSPTFSKFAGELCHGLQLHITDYNAFRPFQTGALIFQEICRQSDKLEYILPHFDRIAGSQMLRDNPTDVNHAIQQAEKEAMAFLNETQYLKEP